MKILRIDTGICPRCGSKATARLKRDSRVHSSFHFGNPVFYRPSIHEYNCICMVCGVEWKSSLELKPIEINELKVIYREFLNAQSNVLDNTLNKKEEQEVLHEMALDMGLVSESPKKKKNAVSSYLWKTTKDAVLSPFYAVKDFASDMVDMTGSDSSGNNSNGKEVKKETEE